ncbi:T9SS type A sorting domain-containing protein [Flavobacterium aestuarii]|uniref:T9SS type A sorting domain-containing protein n=1 Tax=Flavobacterium aestuarii TaxID=3149227 RepID=UPI0032B38EF5
MKTILKFSLAVLTAMVSLNTYAINDDFLLNVKNAEGKEISFSVNQIQKATVTIYDESHNVIYSETVSGKEGISRAYSLQEFPEGVYFLTVETSLKKVTHEIVVTDAASTLSRKSVAEVYKGGFKMKSDNVATAN